MTKTKVLWISDDPWQSTGYGMVGRNVLKALQDTGNFEVYAVATQFKGKDIPFDGYTVLPSLRHPDGYDVIEPYVKKYNIDVIVTLRDVGLQEGYVPIIHKLRLDGWKGKWYGYCPVDTKDIALDWDKCFRQMDGVIAMSEWGARMMLEQANIKAITIPHGVDTKMFRPLSVEEKKKLRSNKPWSETFVVGAVGRNQYRKMWNYNIRAFGQFAKDKSDVMFMFHSDLVPMHPADGWSFEYIGMKNKCLQKMMPTFPNLTVFTRFFVDDNKMNEVYNLFDVFCLPTGGEGFGIPLLEAQACGIPVITLEYTSGIELCKDSGITIPILKDHKGRDVYWEGQNGVEFGIPDWDAITEALQKVYDDPELLAELSKKAREKALKYDWSLITPMWIKLLTELPDQGTKSGDVQWILNKMNMGGSDMPQ